ncbi:DUF6600 domain-containing protein [Trinickia caryophylli]|uniref:DUF6600 domain-containing protein n=1 Tax=Trinickia caryophylli TaxID=28094 RepID=UPI0011AF4FD9|nr:DUF6600 domain-containing protein [Trinickia caryophylli]
MTKRTTSPLVTFRRLTSCVLAASAPFVLPPSPALAQSAPPLGARAATQGGDPPGRVARLNYMAGTVTTEPAGASDWSYASVNRPLTTGDQLWNDANARSELHIGSTAVRLGSSTSLDILNLDDANAQLKVTQGMLSTHVHDLAPGSSYEIDTPNAALAVTRPGDYRIDVSPDGGSTTVTVRRGALTAYGDNGQMPLEAGQQITFSGTSLQVAANDQVPAPDGFDQWAESRDAAAERSVSARYVSREMPGYEDLDANGSWSDDPQYGAVWIPRAVPVGWAPYHNGHWAWIPPWGWTWVDDAPWGFAPYHYGRWAYVGSSWCWVPGPVVSAPPVYAPALVAFVGGSGGGLSWSVGLTIGGAPSPGVAWFPLGPGEAWRPSYGGWSPRYYERVNQTVIVNQTNVNINNIHNTYVNYRAPGAVTAVPATAFVRGRPVAHFAQRVDPAQWHNARINPGAPGIAPVRESYRPGLRPAGYRPPGPLAQRPVVATHAPGVPAVYRDPLAQHLAQTGGQVPGAGRPVAHMTPPAGIAAQMAPRAGNAEAARNVRVVARQSPVVAPGQRQTAGEPGAQGGRGSFYPGGEPQAPRGGLPGAQTRTPGNGVPRPPAAARSEPGAMGGAGPAAAAPRPQPAWTQPHTPMAQQPHGMTGRVDGAPTRAAQGPRAQAPMQPQAERVPQPGMQPTARVPQPGYRESAGPGGSESRVAPRQMGQIPQSRAEEPRVQAQAKARPEPMPQQPGPRVEQPQVQPRFEQPHVQPQPQPHFEQPRPQPQPQPHFEQPRPQPQPQPHFEQPRPQPQPQHPQAQAREPHHQG